MGPMLISRKSMVGVLWPLNGNDWRTKVKSAGSSSPMKKRLEIRLYWLVLPGFWCRELMKVRAIPEYIRLFVRRLPTHTSLAQIMEQP